MAHMSNFASDIEEATNGQPIEAIVIGKEEWRERHPVPPELTGIPISWEMARPHLDYEYDTGFGAADCHAVYAWTKDDVIFVCEYDGSTHMMAVPRSPVATQPEMA